MGKNRSLRYLDPACGNFMRFWQQKAPFCRGKAGYHFANTSLRGQFGKCELVGVKLRHLAIARPFYRLHTPLGCALLNIIQQTRSCKFLYYHIFKTCFAFALTNWIIGPEMITVISVHTPNFPPNKTPVTTTKISNAIRTNLICQ